MEIKKAQYETWEGPETIIEPHPKAHLDPEKSKFKVRIEGNLQKQMLFRDMSRPKKVFEP